MITIKTNQKPDSGRLMRDYILIASLDSVARVAHPPVHKCRSTYLRREDIISTAGGVAGGSASHCFTINLIISIIH